MPDQLITLQQRLTLNDASGTPIPEGTVTFYKAGTTSQVTIYADGDYTTPLANPLTADGAGRIVPVYYNGSSLVDAVIRKADPTGGGVGTGALVDRLENIAKFSTSASGAASITRTPTAENNKTNVQEAIDQNASQIASNADEVRAISKGGTGASTKAGARSNLGLGDIATTNIIDEDDMSSNSASRAPSQQSVKAYVDANAMLGIGQTWQDMSGSRSVSTAYTNSTGRTITVAIDYDNTASVPIQVREAGGSWLTIGNTSSIAGGICTFPVPDGNEYRVNGSTGLNGWLELR